MYGSMVNSSHYGQNFEGTKMISTNINNHIQKLNCIRLITKRNILEQNNKFEVLSPAHSLMGNVSCKGLCVWLTVPTTAYFAGGLHGLTKPEELRPGLTFSSTFITVDWEPVWPCSITTVSRNVYDV